MDKLVSICVISYNSHETIIETLDSIYEQTYEPLELIISDDASHDNTIELVTNWIDCHLNRFTDVHVLTTEENSGVPSNCNRALSACNGEWVKLIAADDCLLPNCIKDNINYINSHKDVRVLCTNYYEFLTNKLNERIIVGSQFSDKFWKKFDVCPQKQLKVYIKYGYNITPSAFVKLDVYKEVQGFNVKYKLFEDTPFFTKVLLSNIKIYSSPLYTVLYRIGNSSITHSTTESSYYKKEFKDNDYQFRKDIIYKIYRWYELTFWIKEFSNKSLYLFCTRILKNKKNKANNFLFYLFKSLNPYFWIVGIKNRIISLHKRHI